MKKITKLIMLFLVLCNLSSFSQTTLGVGDIAFIGLNFDGNDDYSFILLKEIQPGTQIRFTDYGWSDTTGFATGVAGDSEWVWTSSSSLTCGSVVTIITSSLSASTGTVTLPPSEATPLLSSAGDQIFAFQGSLASPSFISAVHSNIQGSTTDSNWDNNPTTNQNSALPDVLTNGVNAIRLYNIATGVEIDNWQYNCAVVNGTSSVVSSGINNINNWINNDGTPYTPVNPGCTFMITCPPLCVNPTVPTVTATINPVCSGNTTTLNISGSLNSATQWSIYTGSCGGTLVGTTTNTTFVVTPTGPSTTYYVRGEGGCVTPGSCGTLTVNVNPTDNASFSYGSASYCVTATDPTPIITGLSGGTFSSTAGLSINTSTGTIDVSASTPATYTVTYTTSGPCPNSSNVSVTINALDNAAFSYGASSYCNNASDPTPTISGVPGGTFTSSPSGLSINASTGTIDVSASTPNNYIVTYTTSGICPNSSNTIVTINALDNASFSYSAASYCVNSLDPTPTITGLTGGTFSSTAGLSINASTGTIDVSASTPATYTVTYTTAGSCPNSSSVSVTINALDNASFNYGASSYCNIATDPTPTITGLAGGTFSSTAGLSINASTGTIDVSASTPATYSVTYTTAGSCPNSSSVSVTINALDNASFNYGASSYCNNATDPTPTITGLAGGTFSSTAGLSINASTGTIDVSASMPATYTVTYTTTGVCSNSSNVSVTIANSIVASASVSNNVSCNGGTNGSVTASVSGGTAPYTYQWSNGATTATVTGLAAATYNVTITDANGCSDMASATITQPSALVATAIVDNNVTCGGGNNGSVTASATGGTPPYTYLWSNGATTATVTGLTAATYNVTITDANGCTDNASITITQPSALVATAIVGDNVSCNGGADGSATATATGGNPPYTYSWSNGATTATVTGLAAATYNVTIVDSNGCIDMASATITQPAAIDNTISQSAGILTANETGASYQWYQCPNTLLNGETNQTFTPTTVGDYKVVITVDFCFVESACETVTVLGTDTFENNVTFSMYPNPSSGILTIKTSIDGDFIIANQLGQTVKSFKVNGGIENTINIENLSDGIYFVKGTNGTQISSQRLIIKK